MKAIVKVTPLLPVAQAGAARRVTEGATTAMLTVARAMMQRKIATPNWYTSSLCSAQRELDASGPTGLQDIEDTFATPERTFVIAFRAHTNTVCAR
ncbi:hypothetical protein BZM27_44345 [Paraburkholderia steynii]|uniref:Uncharacterized protein n=1 Tax=Paraburkholderia steynii TaxID=1245441 RepID=A0A4R0XDA5_9BURK|nr:hypothetical protein BZM27_44345 [Paraburkholderia steynii]